jgi:hypothetical protein
MQDYLHRLDAARYGRNIDSLGLSSIGQHTRHVIEFLECLVEQRSEGVINYDRRRRNKTIETDPGAAAAAIDRLLATLPGIDTEEALILESCYDDAHERSCRSQTTFGRELVYNIEHAIHHLAMIRIALKVVAPEIPLAPSFGVAPSTMRHQRHGSA